MVTDLLREAKCYVGAEKIHVKGCSYGAFCCAVVWAPEHTVCKLKIYKSTMLREFFRNVDLGKKSGRVIACHVNDCVLMKGSATSAFHPALVCIQSAAMPASHALQPNKSTTGAARTARLAPRRRRQRTRAVASRRCRRRQRGSTAHS